MKKILDKYKWSYAKRADGLRSSAMRDLMSITARKDIISLAGGLPDTASFSADLLAEITGVIVARNCSHALQYGPTDGLEETKRNIVEVMAAEGMHIDTNRILITTGAQQGIDLVTKTFINPGDYIIAEAPTYPGAIPSFTGFQAKVIQIPLDEHGVRLDLMRQEMNKLRARNIKPKFIYLIPNFHNPAGVTLNHRRRLQLVELAGEDDILIVEDNPYGQLRFEGERLPSIYSLDPDERVIYLSTFSKILSPGIRLGWVVGPEPILQKLKLGKQAADLCPSTIGQLIVNEYFVKGQWQEYICRLIDIYRSRRDAMLFALDEYFPVEARWTSPQGGFFIWVELPSYINTADLLAAAINNEKVAFVPGSGAWVDGSGANFMRLAFCGVDESTIREGIIRLSRVIAEQLALYRALKG